MYCIIAFAIAASSSGLPEMPSPVECEFTRYAIIF